jgi:hypothetical protein
MPRIVAYLVAKSHLDKRLAANSRFKKDPDIARTTDWAWLGVEQPLWVMPLKKDDPSWENVAATSGNERLASRWERVIDESTCQEDRLEALGKAKRLDIGVDGSGGLWHRSEHGRRDVHGGYAQAPGQ